MFYVMTTTLGSGILGGLTQKPSLSFSIVVAAMCIDILVTNTIHWPIGLVYQLLFAYAAAVLGFLYTDRLMEVNSFFAFENNYKQMVCTGLAICGFVASMVAYEVLYLTMGLVYTGIGFLAVFAFLWFALAATLPHSKRSQETASPYPFTTRKSVMVFMLWSFLIVATYLNFHFLILAPGLHPHAQYWTELISISSVLFWLGVIVACRRLPYVVRASSKGINE
jgi:hypothetical protein